MKKNILKNQSRRTLIKQMILAGLMTSVPIACRRSNNISSNDEQSLTFYWQQIEISLDDFGTGYSSLNYLKRFPTLNSQQATSFLSSQDQVYS